MKFIFYYFNILLAVLLLTQSESSAQWVQTNGPFGGTVKCFAVSDSRIYAGTSYGGIFISSNNGTNWKQVNNGLTNLNITALFIRDTITLASTDDGVYLFSDNGNHWVLSSLGNGINSFAENKDYLFATGYTGVFRSSDNGKNWNQMGSDSLFVQYPKSITVIDSVIIVGTENSIIRSNDNGITWSKIGNFNSVNSFAFTGSYIFATTYSGLYRSTDTGISWTLANNKYPFDLSVYSLAKIGSNIFAASAYDGVFLSTDNGANWIQVNNGLLYANIGTIYSLAAKDNSIFAGTLGGVFRSTDYGANWTQNNNGITASYINSIVSQGDSLFASGMGVFLTTNNGADWISVNYGLPPSYGFSSLAFCGNNLFAGSGGVFRSTNDGAEWTNVSNGIRPSSNVQNIVVKGKMVFIGTEYFTGGAIDGGEIYLSTNNGTNWLLKSANMNSIASLFTIENYIFTGTDFYGGSYRSKTDTIQWIVMHDFDNLRISSFGAIGSTIFAATPDGIFISTNEGENWSKINNPLLQSISGITTNGNDLFAGSFNGSVFHSTDIGVTWSTVNEGLPNRYGILNLWISGDYIYAGTYGTGVWRRPLSDFNLPVELTSFTPSVNLNNITLLWKTATEVNTSKFEVEKKSSAGVWGKIVEVKATGNSNAPKSYSYTDSKLATGKYSYRLKIVDLDGTFKYSNEIQAAISIPNEFNLSQNYPNPFNPNTAINYSLPKDGKVELTVYNSIGSKVATIVAEYKPAGNYSVQFNGNNLASGIYFYKLESGTFSDTKKFILLK